MKPELIEHAGRLASDAHHSSNVGRNVIDGLDIAELGWELVSGAIDLAFGWLS